MNVHTDPTSQTRTERRVRNRTTQTDELLELGNSRGWKFDIIGKAPMPQEHYRQGDWLVVPANIDRSPIPVRAMQRIQAIHASGIEPKGFVLVHEAPKLLAAGETDQQIEIDRKPIISIPPERVESIRTGLKTAGGILGTAAVATGTLALGALAIVALLPLALIAGVVLLDPILIAVTDDDTWVEIDRW